MVLLSAIRRALLLRDILKTYGVDYAETFSRVANIGSVRMLISFAASLGCLLFQVDVKNAFLHGNLDEVYIEQPLGYVAQGKKGQVCCLHKSLYGLKQSLRALVWKV